MRAQYWDGEKLQTVPAILEAIGAADHAAPVVSVVGAGGKTTTIGRMVREAKKRGREALVFTTTHMREENCPWFTLESEGGKENSLEKVESLFQTYGSVCIGRAADGGKIKSISEPLRDILLEKCREKGRIVLIEADGAKCLPLKVPAEHEPVILPETTHVLSLYGMDAVGGVMEKVCFRTKAAAKLLGKGEKERITPEDIALLSASEAGGRKGCPLDAAYWVILNKADGGERLTAAQKICKLLCDRGFKHVLVTGEEV